MSSTFVWALVAVVVAALALRLALPGLPIARSAQRLTFIDAALVVLGVAGLVFHCGAMFFVDRFRSLPFSDGAIDAIRRMDTASVLLYAIPACLVLAGLRRLHPIALAALTIAFIAVGITMYNGGPLDTHLTAIMASAVTLSAALALLALPPRLARA